MESEVSFPGLCCSSWSSVEADCIYAAALPLYPSPSLAPLHVSTYPMAFTCTCFILTW